MGSRRFMRWVNLAALVLVVALNAFANVFRLGGQTTGQVSADYPTLFTPAGVTFSIWGALYLLMLIFAIFQMGITKNEVEGINMRLDVDLWFVISCAMNAGWVISWHFGAIGLSVLFILGLLVSLVQIVDRIELHKFSSAAGRVSVIGFHLYLGWICAATIANMSVFLTKIHWSGWGLSEEAWTIMVLIVAAALGIALSIVRKAPAATLALVWAFAGILVRHVSITGYQAQYPLIIVTILAGIAFMLGAMLVSIRALNFGRVRRLESGASSAR